MVISVMIRYFFSMITSLSLGVLFMNVMEPVSPVEGFAFGNNWNQRRSSSKILCDGTDWPDARGSYELSGHDGLYFLGVSVLSGIHMEEDPDHGGRNRITGTDRDHNHYQFYVYGADHCGKTQ